MKNLIHKTRLLDAERDIDVHREAWHWRDDAPRWFQESLDIVKETWEDYVAAIPNELHYGIFVEDKPVAIVRLIETMPWIFNIHLAAKRKTDFAVILEAGLNLKHYLFEQGVRGFFGWIPVMHRSVIRLYRELGFEDSGIRCYKGQIRGRVCELQQMVCANERLLETVK